MSEKLKQLSTYKFHFLTGHVHIPVAAPEGDAIEEGTLCGNNGNWV